MKRFSRSRLPAAGTRSPQRRSRSRLRASANVRSFAPWDTASSPILDGSIGIPIFLGITSGWGAISFPLINTQVLGTPTEILRNTLLGFAGLPAIGFAVIERNNSADAGNNRNYGSGRPHVVDLIAP